MKCFVLLGITLMILLVDAEGETKKKKKSILDYSEAELHQIYEQWEENDEERDDEDDDDDPYKPKPLPPLDIKYDKSGKIDPEHLLRQSKRGKPLMMFVGMRAGVEQRYTEQVSGRWQQGLQNAHIPVQRYVVAPDRVMFMLQDGSKVWEVKDYLVRQPECSSVNFEQLEFPCATETKGKTEL